MGVYEGPIGYKRCDPCGLELTLPEFEHHRRTKGHNEKFLASRGVPMPRGGGGKLPASWEDRDSDDAKERASRIATGAASELLVLADLARRGYVVLTPAGGLNPRYDLVYDARGTLRRVQVKTSARDRLLVAIGQRKWRFDHSRGVNVPYVKPQYMPDDFDILAIVDRASGRPYYVPNEDIDFEYHEVYIKNELRERYLDPPE